MEFALIAGIIGAAVGAASGLIGTLTDDYRARERDQERLNQIEEDYSLATKEAELKYKQAEDEARRNAEKAKVQADLIDQSAELNERTLSSDVNSAIDDLYLSQAADTYSWNNAAMQAASSTGASYAALGASGVRAGSSLSEAVLMESATNSAQLQFSQDAKRRQDSNNLSKVLSSLAGGIMDIRQNRIGADWTRGEADTLIKSFSQGGSNYNLYQNQLNQLKASRDHSKTEVNRDWEEHAGWNSFWNAFISMHTMGAKGFSSGYNVGNSIKNGMKPDYTTSLGGSN